MTQNKIKSIDWTLLHTFGSNAPDIKNDQQEMLEESSFP